MVTDVNIEFQHAVVLCPQSQAMYMKVIIESMIIILTVLSSDYGRRILLLNSSSACRAHIPAELFSASTSLLNLMRSLILFLSCAANSLLNLAFVSSSKAGLLSKLAGIFIPLS